ncbi:hypothetical protein GCM10009677_13070 [Sphaerisporangium rubeum]|uniref:GNAT family N-acetyltransferase n=1 Tax=Sphaerisporangium rubeum TaxID=321317 RepID=A0A7X0IEN3_9ACTN|nr:GNAT family N-acetyltransferase [Sphaerisporangium rubeum]MBB6473834.1 hypothetical protein [Sphaerisporangium rubeum]
MTRELTRPADITAAAPPATMLHWAVQGRRPGVRVFTHRDAVAVACPALARRDRLTVTGPPADAVPLVRHALAETGPTYRPLGGEPLIRHLAAHVPGLEFAAAFHWLDTRTAAPGATGDATWLTPADEPAVTTLLAAANPGSYAVPGLPGVHRWAGIRGGDGTPVSVGADAWSTPGAGFIAGVATAAAHRGLGHAETVCRFLVNSLHAHHGYVALMADAGNHTAAGIYHRLGLTRHTVAAARLTTPT